jgi:hypothetical protein
MFCWWNSTSGESYFRWNSMLVGWSLWNVICCRSTNIYLPFLLQWNWNTNQSHRKTDLVFNFGHVAGSCIQPVLMCLKWHFHPSSVVCVLGWHFWVMVVTGDWFFLMILLMGFLPQMSVAMKVVYISVVLYNEHIVTIFCNSFLFCLFLFSYMTRQIS